MTTQGVILPDDLRRQIVDHCLDALPNEGCGMLALEGDLVMNVYPTGNDDASPVSYTIPPQEHYDALIDAESQGWRLGGVFHSHPRGPSRLSDTDMARLTDSEWIYVVVDLGGGNPVVTGWKDAEEVEVIRLRSKWPRR